MKTFKSILLFSTLILLLSGCSSDNCESLDCGVNGTCVDGTCQCDEGYTGTNCQTLIDPCANIDCGTNGSCIEGICECDLGYEGDACETQSRQKYVGVYIGDMLPCLPSIVAGAVPADLQAELAATEVQVTADDPKAQFLTVGSTSDLLGFELITDITEENFEIPVFEEEVDAGISVIKVQGMGTGMYVDENTIQLDLEISFEVSGFPFNTMCSVNFTKQ